VARELLGQLGCEEVLAADGHHAAVPTVPDQDARGRDADGLGVLIDEESRGDTRILTALESVRRIIAAISGKGPHLFVVLMPRFGMPWRLENTAFIELLADALAAADSGVMLAAGCHPRCKVLRMTPNPGSVAGLTVDFGENCTIERLRRSSSGRPVAGVIRPRAAGTGPCDGPGDGNRAVRRRALTGR